jgi:hypothetical protein
MNFRIRKMIEKLEQGHEFCGICGKDVTDAPDCMHSPFPLTNSCVGGLVAVSEATTATRMKYEDTLYSRRIGCEMLLDPSELETLTVFDPVNVFGYDWVAMFQGLSEMDRLSRERKIFLTTKDNQNYSIYHSKGYKS